MSFVKSFAIGNGDMYYIRVNADRKGEHLRPRTR
jgi:hypothetical protein